MFSFNIDSPGIFTFNQIGQVLQKVFVTDLGIILLPVVHSARTSEITIHGKVFERFLRVFDYCDSLPCSVLGEPPQALPSF